MLIPGRCRDKDVREMREGREEDKEQKVRDKRMKAKGEERERDESSRHTSVIKIIMYNWRNISMADLLRGIKGSHSRRTSTSLWLFRCQLKEQHTVELTLGVLVNNNVPVVIAMRQTTTKMSEKHLCFSRLRGSQVKGWGWWYLICYCTETKPIVYSCAGRKVKGSPKSHTHPLGTMNVRTKCNDNLFNHFG